MDRTDDFASPAARPTSSHVLHTVQPRFGWIGASVVAILALQLALTMFMAFRLWRPAAEDSSANRSAAANRSQKADPQQQRLVASLESLSQEMQHQRRVERLDAQQAWFKQMLGRVKIDSEGKVDVSALVAENRRQQQRLKELQGAHEALESVNELNRRLTLERDKLAHEIVVEKQYSVVHAKELAEAKRLYDAAELALKEERDKAKQAKEKQADAKNKKGDTSTNDISSKTPTAEADEPSDESVSAWWVVGGVVVVLLLAGAGVGVYVNQRTKTTSNTGKPPTV